MGRVIHPPLIFCNVVPVATAGITYYCRSW